MSPQIAQAVTVLALLLFGRPAAAEGPDPEPFVFSILACAVHGSGFLAEDVPGIPGVSVITAMHVVGSCPLVELRRTYCDETPVESEAKHAAVSFGKLQTVRAWPELDVVAIPITPNAAWDAKPKPLPAKPMDPKFDARLKVYGIDAANSCPRGAGDLRNRSLAGQLLDQLKTRTDYGAADIGGLARSTRLFIMSSTGGHGVSGGAVLDEQWNLIGMYQGGYTSGYSTNWAVSLSVAELAASPAVDTTLEKLPNMSQAKLANAYLDDYARNAPDSPERPTGLFIAAQANAFHQFGEAAASGGLFELAGYVPFIPGFNTSLGLFATAGIGVARTDQVYRGPLSTSIVERTEVGFNDYRLALGLGLRGWQQHLFRMGAAADIRLGARSVKDLRDGEPQADFLWGPEVRFYPCFSALWLLSACITLSAGATNHQREAYRIELGSPVTAQEGRAWDFDGSVGLSIALGSWIRLKAIEGGNL